MGSIYRVGPNTQRRDEGRSLFTRQTRTNHKFARLVFTLRRSSQISRVSFAPLSRINFIFT